MANWHDENDTLEQLKRDVRDPDNPQSQGSPTSVRQSAAEELRRRGFSEKQITEFRLKADPF